MDNNKKYIYVWLYFWERGCFEKDVFMINKCNALKNDDSTYCFVTNRARRIKSHPVQEQRTTYHLIIVSVILILQFTQPNILRGLGNGKMALSPPHRHPCLWLYTVQIRKVVFKTVYLYYKVFTHFNIKLLNII